MSDTKKKRVVNPWKETTKLKKRKEKTYNDKKDGGVNKALHQKSI